MADNLTEATGIEPYVQGTEKTYFLPYLKFTDKSTDSKILVYDHKGGGETLDTGAKIGEFATYTIIYYPSLEKYDFYTNGNYILSGNYLRSEGKYPSVDEVNKLRIGIGSGNIGDYYIDNISISYLKLEFDSNVIQPLDFESVTAEDISRSLSLGSSTASVITKGEHGKSLCINKVEGGVTATIEPMASMDGYNTTVTSFDILIENPKSIVPIEIYLRDNDRNRLFLVFLSTDSTDTDATYYAQDRARGERVQTTGKVGEWNNVTIKFYSEKSAWLLYINGSFVMMGNTRFDSNGVQNPTAADIGRCSIYFGQTGVGNIYLDNILHAKTVEEADDSLFDNQVANSKAN